MRTVFSFLIGLVAGMMVGAATALLLTPYSGDEFRGMMGDRANEFSGSVRDAYYSRRAQLEAELDALRKRGAPAE
jgi:gas vesicle protein